MFRFTRSVLLAVSLVLCVATPAATFFGLYDYNSFKLGATWNPPQPDGSMVSYAVKIVDKPGNPYHGVRYLLNDPTVCEYLPFQLACANGQPFQRIAIPPAPAPVPGNPRNPYAPQADWNSFDWAADAAFQRAVERPGYVNQYVPNRWYAAPPGAPCHPLYKHLCR